MNQATHSVGTMCRVLKISRSGFYAWLDRPMCERRRFDLMLTGKIEAIHRRSRGTYGSPNIHAELADDHAIHVGRKRVARLMRAAGLKGATLRRYVVTTQADPRAERPIDLVEREFYATAPNRLWVADITYIPTWSGFLYLAMVLDVFSRKIVGWAMDTHLRTELILQALEMAVTQRQPSGVIHHSDRGCQYTSYAFGKRCREAGVTLFRFHIPLVEPDVQIYRIRLSRKSLKLSLSPRLPDSREGRRGRASRRDTRLSIGGTRCLASLVVGATIAVDGAACISGSPGMPG